ncbi:cation-translocating P-type ATPase [Pseudoxanthomonas sp. SE1]|uniref:cation-translocating P-type ATPase n=1 Tax=Pseudoxanthomonas sp. SE1 TaxID=1664560 RepID=UPI00240E7273|nr:cation-translocating P-type ATPase [Pseudoxanthomonas sp. SE1]WFC41548.1 cation-translocating P-type ATPase [Pseudoxanthomonas sp. SE1]
MPAGLSSADARRKLEENGPNLMPRAEGRSSLRIAAGVIREPMLALLVAAAAIYLVLGDLPEASVLAVSVLLVIGLAFYQEYRSERALDALRDLSSPRARVRRDGESVLLPAQDIVVGDILLMAEGDRVIADARLLPTGDGHVSELELDESMLTGESMPVRRAAGSASTDRIHAGTLVLSGHALAEVVATGARSAIGRIGVALGSVRTPPTPLQRQIRHAITVFALLALVVSASVVILHFSVHGDWLQAALAGITLAMANIPEEFPVVLSVFLTLGAWRMARHQALVRRPPAIEALGAVTVLCTDKTGTLTENRMAVAELLTPEGHIMLPVPLPPHAQSLIECGDAASADDPVDPMERALRTAVGDRPSAARPLGAQRVREYPLMRPLPVVGHAWRPSLDRPDVNVYCKGAPETVAALCELQPDQRAGLLAGAASMARRGLRVLAVATATGLEAAPATLQDCPLQWRGLIGFADPLRDGVPEAIREALAAGVRVVMLTGDHPETARAIAAQAGICGEANIFARVKPEQKLAMVDELRQAGHVVAMTGDGVNDAPALAAAHVGIAMGKRGTEVAREAASIVLLDDNFVTIIRAIRNGRVIYDNIVRAVRYILSVHVPITGLALLPLLLGDPLVLLPLHVVFLELIIDPASTLVFEQEPGVHDVMHRPPRDPSHHLLGTRLLFESFAQGLIALLAVSVVYMLGRSSGLAAAQNGALAFIALVMGNLSLIVANRTLHGRKAWWRRRNPTFWSIVLAASVLTGVATQVRSVSGWSGFESPPVPLTLVAVLLPPVLLFVADGIARTMGSRPPASPHR